MTRPYSEDLRERAVARAERGETVRAIAAALQISPSCISKWRKLQGETGSLSPGKMNGHKKRVLTGSAAEWLRERIRSGPFTSPKLRRNWPSAASKRIGAPSGFSCGPRA